MELSMFTQKFEPVAKKIVNLLAEEGYKVSDLSLICMAVSEIATKDATDIYNAELNKPIASAN
jgi:hypothetical protein